MVPTRMLDNSTLAQLKQLKQNIEDSKEFAVGIVKGTARKFGFVVLEDGREIFLAPDEMQKVFPGDKVKILVISEQKKPVKGAKAKVSGKLEKLLGTELKEFTGRYIIKGQGHFVEPDLPRLSRWIFIPPAARKNAKAGDYIRCTITRHPYPGGKPQAKIVQHIGSPDKPGIEADYVSSKFQLEPEWPKNWHQQLSEVDYQRRDDRTGTPFITIDAANTVDIDDALYAKTTEQGWQLQIAIADPCAFIPADSELEKVIQRQGTSTYLPGRSIAMLPRELANERCSLLAQQQRPVLLCSINVTADGAIDDYSITEAFISSKAKLTYSGVAAYLADTESNEKKDCEQHRENLLALKSVTEALRRHRQQHHLVISGRQDYRLILNDQRKLQRIEVQQKSSAHSLVEEAMVAANRCVADMLGSEGLYISHTGFRSERLPDVRKLAEEQLALTDIDFSTPEGYRQLMNSIDDDALEFPLRAVLSRLLERSRLSATALPHQGMGLASYTTFTSPIRKFNDFIVHRIIKAKLNNGTSPDYDQQALDQLQLRQDQSRQARNQMEQWLKCQFIQPLKGQTFSGHVSQINSNGFTVRLDDNYIEGFIETRLLTEKYSFDPMRLRLSSKSLTVELNQAIEVIVSEVDCNQRSIRFSLPASASNVKNQTTGKAEARHCAD